MEHVNRNVKKPILISRTFALARTISSSTRSLIRNERDSNNDHSPTSDCASQANTNNSMGGELIEEWPTSKRRKMAIDHLDRRELKQAVKDANVDSMNRVGAKDGLDITLRGYRVRNQAFLWESRNDNSFTSNPISDDWPSKDVNELWSKSSFDRRASHNYDFVTRSASALESLQENEPDVISRSMSSTRRLSLDYECVSRSLRALNIPQDDTISALDLASKVVVDKTQKKTPVKRSYNRQYNSVNNMRSATSVLGIDTMLPQVH